MSEKLLTIEDCEPCEFANPPEEDCLHRIIGKEGWWIPGPDCPLPASPAPSVRTSVSMNEIIACDGSPSNIAELLRAHGIEVSHEY